MHYCGIISQYIIVSMFFSIFPTSNIQRGRLWGPNSCVGGIFGFYQPSRNASNNNTNSNSSYHRSDADLGAWTSVSKQNGSLL